MNDIEKRFYERVDADREELAKARIELRELRKFRETVERERKRDQYEQEHQVISSGKAHAIFMTADGLRAHGEVTATYDHKMDRVAHVRPECHRQVYRKDAPLDVDAVADKYIPIPLRRYQLDHFEKATRWWRGIPVYKEIVE